MREKCESRSIRFFRLGLLLAALCCFQLAVSAQRLTRQLSGIVVTQRNEAVPNVTVTAISTGVELKAVSDADGGFLLNVPAGDVTLRIEGRNIASKQWRIGAGEVTENLRLEIEYVIPPVHDGLVISATQLDPSIDRRNDAIYRDTLFGRDDQVFHTLDAGINVGQHEGGGKSLEIRRFGFNMDHGGVNGGLKVLVDNVQQNQGTQGHGQGYLGQLKSLTPELVQDVNILNGPFSAEYGDFSGLGVVHIRLKESLPDQVTARIQGGSFNSFRTVLAYSPTLEEGTALLAYEGSRTDGPFVNPSRYKRDNVTGNYVRKLDEVQTLGFKVNIGRNDFYSSGQIPLDQVFAGTLDRFGFIDPDTGGRVRNGTVGAYYKRDLEGGSTLKIDGFLARSLFDLYSNFTFFLNDEANGDEFVQHDSRLQEGANAQYLHPFKVFGQTALLNIGGNFHDNQIKVGLSPTIARTPLGIKVVPSPLNIRSDATAHVTNAAAYVQQGLDLLHGHVHLEGGIRFDYFHFNMNDRLDPSASGAQGATRAQPKFNVALTPTDRFPLTLYFNYGRGISSQDARGVVRRPDAPRISTTDFYQVGYALNFSRVSVSSDLFLIDRSNEQVYIPDDGSFELKGPSRATGFEVKTSIRLTRFLSFNSGVTKVMNAFFRGSAPRVYVDSAPHMTGNASLTLSGWKGFSGSLRYRHTSNYRLDGEDATIKAAGLDVFDLSVSKRLRPWVDFNLSVDNLTDKHYFETQNYFDSRLGPGLPVAARIHATPGFPVTVTAGLTFRLSGK